MQRKKPVRHKVTRNGKTFWRGQGQGEMNKARNTMGKEFSRLAKGEKTAWSSSEVKPGTIWKMTDGSGFIHINRSFPEKAIITSTGKIQNRTSYRMFNYDAKKVVKVASLHKGVKSRKQKKVI